MLGSKLNHVSKRGYWWFDISEVQCIAVMVNFLPNPHNRHPIAHPSGRDMGFLLWGYIFCFSQYSAVLMQCCIKISCCIGPCYKSTWLYLSNTGWTSFMASTFSSVLEDHFLLDWLLLDFNIIESHYTPCTTKLLGGILVSLRPSVRPAVPPSVYPTSRVRSVAPTVLVGSISYYGVLIFIKVCRM